MVGDGGVVLCSDLKEAASPRALHVVCAQPSRIYIKIGTPQRRLACPSDPLYNVIWGAGVAVVWVQANI